MSSSREIRFHDTMSRRVETFTPLEAGKVRLYTCGPTVYDYAHIGNFRAYAWEDLLRRFLKHRGLAVTQVMNITDVEDKIIRESARSGQSIGEYTSKYVDAFFEDIDVLGLERAEHYPRATDHVPEMIELIRKLRENGHTYESGGSIYFRIGGFEPYGRLSHLDASGIQAGARVDSDEYEKEDARDFVLWKGHREGEPSWKSPFGEGRPGWHIECSAMSMKYLGESFDIHTGGVDNIFPHHENEIAQSEGATGKRFVRHWLHCAHLMVDGQKMSKSAGNFYTLRDLLGKGLEARAIRYLLLSSHYRKPLNFTIDGAAQAGQALQRLDDLDERLVTAEVAPAAGAPGASPGAAAIRTQASAFEEALANDLNVSEALGAVFDAVRLANAALDRSDMDGESLEAMRALMSSFRYVFGIPPRKESALDAEMAALVERREEARRNRDFAEADRIRDDLLGRGVLIEDTPSGPRWKRVPPRG